MLLLGSIHVKHDCNCYDDSSNFSSKVLEMNNHSESEINHSRGGKRPSLQGAASKNGLTAWASPLLLSGTKVGLCFLGLRVGSLWPPSEPAPPLPPLPPLLSPLLSPPASSPVQPQILPLVEGMFSLLVSDGSGAILFSDRKLGRKRKPC